MARTIEKFAEMKPEYPQWTEGNQIFSLKNVDPIYYLASSSTQEKQRFPLVAGRSFTNLSLGLPSNVVFAIPSEMPTRGLNATFTDSYDIFTSDDSGRVYGIRGVFDTSGAITSSLVTFRGLPFGGPGTNYVNKICVFAGKLVAVRSDNFGGSAMSYHDITSLNTTWTNYAAPQFQARSTVDMETFLDGLYITDGYLSTSGNNNHSVIKIENSGSAIVQNTTVRLTLPAGYVAQRLANYANRYLVVAGAYNARFTPVTAGTVLQNSRNFLFFWNGISPTYQYSIQLPGAFVDMCMIGDRLKVMVKDKFGQYSIYNVNGQSLSLDTTLQIDEPANSPMFSFMGLTGIALSTKGVYVYGKTGAGDVKYILSSTPYSIIVSETTDSRVYAITGSTVAVQQVTGTSFLQPEMVSQWVSLDTKLTSIDVMYDTPPAGPGDYIRVTLDSYAEDQTDGVLTQQLADITSTNYDTRIKTTLDTKGLTPSMARVTVTANSSTGWRPIIRQIQFNESKQ